MIHACTMYVWFDLDYFAGFSEEEYMRQATRVSSSFVSAILANAMAEYIKYQQQDNHSLQKIYPIQVKYALRYTLYR